ncbi:uncharacterized protein SPSK_02410 [Sporothrix schenckii 1099-18]|uniref:BZIP domain-containing protein n=1 Tax=Sporothrix schenckii 1099-18 TaxID=1397361 RepID=A0A0F2MET7_SPOSC|nr:uncharacterized protein SPSK_02410 [Sporothrix schenckii 1099-18]KJR86671.1 hypothetical protein SPSK_02410 [Sporothrix schenckii 1099-18]
MPGNDTKIGVADTNAAARARRRVCNLTPSQVEKKRAIDRTNQQHWRQKKRLYIAELEAEVARLKDSLDVSHARLRVLEGNNDDGRGADQDAGSTSPAQDLCGAVSVLDVSAVPAVSFLPMLLPATSQARNNTIPDRATPLRSVSSGSSTASDGHSLTHSVGNVQLDFFDTTAFQLLDNPEIDGHIPVDVDDVFGAQPLYPDFPAAIDHTYHQHEPLQHQSEHRHEQRSQAPFYRQNIQRYQALYGATPPSPFLTNLSYMPYYLASRYSASRSGMPDWMVLPLNMPVATELDKLVLITSQALVQRYSTNEFCQPVFPSIEGLMSPLSTDNRPRSARNGSASSGTLSNSVMGEELLQALAAASAGGASSILSASSLKAAARASAVAAAATNPPSLADSSSAGDGEAASLIASRPVLAAVATHVVWKSPLKNLTGRLSFLYKLAIYLRWCLCPTKENYEAIPDYLKPTQLQRRVPHPAWVDIIIWPDVRDSLIRSGDYSAFELLRFVIGNTLSLNWPFTEAHTFIECADGKRLTLNPIFEAHIRNLENYSVGYQAARAFPILSRYVRVT